MSVGLTRSRVRRWWTLDGIFCEGSGLVAFLAQSDDPIRSCRSEIGLAVVAGVCQYRSDQVIGIAGDGVIWAAASCAACIIGRKDA
jgi:hypothetical protein